MAHRLTWVTARRWYCVWKIFGFLFFCNFFWENPGNTGSFQIFLVKGSGLAVTISLKIKDMSRKQTAKSWMEEGGQEEAKKPHRLHRAALPAPSEISLVVALFPQWEIPVYSWSLPSWMRPPPAILVDTCLNDRVLKGADVFNHETERQSRLKWERFKVNIHQI